jgi:hypothetical protein
MTSDAATFCSKVRMSGVLLQSLVDLNSFPQGFFVRNGCWEELTMGIKQNLQNFQHSIIEHSVRENPTSHIQDSWSGGMALGAFQLHQMSSQFLHVDTD